VPQSPIHAVHEAEGARFVDFGGWTMPVQYSGVLAEHAAVRENVGIFDVSHLGRFEVAGPHATDVLRQQLCNDITKVEPGRAQYTMALNERGGVEDDIIVWRLEKDRYWVMPNGTNSDEIVARFRAGVGAETTVEDIRDSSVLFAVQGPKAADVLETVLGVVPGRFRIIDAEYRDTMVIAAGTGYTGERGAEIWAPLSVASGLWMDLRAAGATACGLGSRDTLRLEMGFPLWGQDLDEDTTPLEAGLGWVVAWDHDFVGKDALLAQKGNLTKELVAFTTEGRAIPRHGYEVTTSSGSGVVSSGNFSPTLGHGIGMAYVSPPMGDEDTLTVTIRKDRVPGTRVTLPFLDR